MVCASSTPEKPAAIYNDTTTPMLRQYMGIKANYPDAILMYRLGDFYEMFYEDALVASKILDITLTSRNRNEPNPVPLCGVPYHSVEPYIAKLLENGKKVAICEQVEDPKTAKGVVKREVTRVVTPGVVPDGLNLAADSHNFVAAIFAKDGSFGLSLADISTGIFQASPIIDEKHLFEELLRLEPREILVPSNLGPDDALAKRINRVFSGLLITRLDSSQFDTGTIKHLEGVSTLTKNSPAAAAAAAGVFSYLSSTQSGRVSHIKRVVPLSGDSIMRLDESTKRNLEIVRTMQDNEKENSLVDFLNKTSTAAGARKLKRWLLYPLTHPAQINARLDAVNSIVSDTSLLKDLPEILAAVYDMERITSRAAMGLANARDLIGLSVSLKAAGRLKTIIADYKNLLGEISTGINPHDELVQKIDATIVDEPPFSLREGGLIRQGFSPELDAMLDIIAHGKDYIARLEAKEKQATGISSLKIRYNKVFGYYLEVTNTHRDKVPQHYIRKQTLANAERFITPDLKEYEEKILGAQEKGRALEYEIFSQLRDEVGACADSLLRSADFIATLDVLTSFARVAAQYNYVRPKVDRGSVIDIRDGRHPIVERLNPVERFVPNDVYLDCGENRLIIITGPNMAGKSTVMRQCALIVLMAQTGCFIPATSATIGVVDRIFTRVGASDALAKGQSTFMVEMSEAATILSEATAKSLIIIDEIGRGTSTFDGLAIAWSIAEDIHDRVGARTLFATHYHELTELALTKPGIHNMQIAVKEWNGEVIFLRRLVTGATSRSYGIAVARLAGLPNLVIERAQEVLENLESGEYDEMGRPRLASSHNAQPEKSPVQYPLFTNIKPNEIELELGKIDVNAITPIEALNILSNLKAKV